MKLKKSLYNLTEKIDVSFSCILYRLSPASRCPIFSHCCINFNRLKNRKYRKGFSPNYWILDAGTFAGLAPNLEEYADAAHRWSWCGTLEAVVAPDLLCQPQHLQKTGLSVNQHQTQTILNYDALKKLVKAKIYIMPVLQGLTPQDYQRHLSDYGNRIALGAWVGVGSLLGRERYTITRIIQIIQDSRPDLKLHGFGCGKRVLKHCENRHHLWSADSSAWSKTAQLEKLRRGSNSNNPNEAIAYLESVNSANASMQIGLIPMLDTDCERQTLFSRSVDGNCDRSRKR